ncbi:MAG: DNA polymerase/3'-5' exonuclease PolX [Thermodesulfobacteriota bacterium]|nr:DNA polymerase/3'-5' exonuclease PolX [Thermodesulfobacteriota bacterium]
MDRKHVANVLEELAVLLELKGESPFKIRAYQQAARTVLSLEQDLEELVTSGGLAKVRGIGKSLTGHITELVKTGGLKYLDELRKSFPAGFLEILKVQGLGPKKVKILYEDLGVTNLGELEYACQENRLISLKGFGVKSQAKVLQGLENLKKYRGRFLWSEVEPKAGELTARLAEGHDIERVELAGRFRRGLEVLTGLDLVVVSSSPAKAARYLEKPDLVESIDGGAKNRFTIRLKSGLGADLRFVSAESFPFAWRHFTGSREHNAVMRRRAKAMGLELSDVTLLDRTGRARTAADEAGIFSLLDLPFIPPELREGLGEIEAAETGSLPDLVREADLKGIFHVHSTYSDGGLSIAELTAHCRDLGYEYLGLSDHSQSARYAGGLTLADLERQLAEVKKVRAGNPGFGLFWGIESDILPDGSLDYPDEVLAGFDFVIASVHSGFSMPEKEMTARLVRAVTNPYTTILGHPTGRLLLAREPYAMDLPAVLAAAAKNGTVIEINANPHRLDLDWREMRRAKALGLKLMIGPDAHSAAGLRDTRHGVRIARKGRLTKDDVLNCLGREDIDRFLVDLRKRRQG